MCGIGGWLGNFRDTHAVADRMVRKLRHRGPNGHEIRSWPEATLVHTRLSIIDLSASGTQPMSNEDETVWTVVNGEIYNHRELRHELEGRGHKFRGYSDAEVVPHLYEEEGSEFVARLKGMFALALYDRRTRRLLLARDRFGIKPLFFASGRQFVFASEIQALREVPDIDLNVNRQAVYDFAALTYIPAPETFFKGIRALQPGEMLEAQFDADRVSWQTQAYHQWAIAPDFTMTLDQAVEQANSLLTAAVQRQMQSDVPLGTLLSGGIDFSLVSAAAQGVLGDDIRSFNVRFAEKEYDETWEAVAVAEHIGSRHEILDMDKAQGSWDEITRLLQQAGQPFADTSIFAVNRVCSAMRPHVTVALSGDGGDEGFGGYNIYWRIARMARWQQLPDLVWRGVAAVLPSLVHYGATSLHFARQFGELSRADNTAIIQHMFCWLNDGEHRDLCYDTNLLPVRRLFEQRWEHDLPSQPSRLERLSAHATEVNIRMTLANDFLFKVDTASMKESLEIRVPMLDEDLFSFGLSIPHALKVKGRTCKRVLRAIAERKLPHAVAHKPKCGFGIPIDKWVDKDFKVRLRETLLNSASKLPEFFRPEVYSPMLKAFCNGDHYPGVPRQNLYQLAIVLLSVHLALDHNALS